MHFWVDYILRIKSDRWTNILESNYYKRRKRRQNLSWMNEFKRVTSVLGLQETGLRKKMSLKFYQQFKKNILKKTLLKLQFCNIT